VVQLREFLKHAKNPPPRPESPPARVKVEYDVYDTSATRLSSAGQDIASVGVHSVKTRIVQEGNREVLEILSDSEQGSDSKGFATHGERPSGDLGHEMSGT
jgi:hypothetical protein